MVKPNYSLLAGGAISALISILHVILALRPALYRHISAGQESALAQIAEQGSTPTTIATVALALIFGIWALYAFSGTGLINPLPWLRAALIAIGVIYILRSLFIPTVYSWYNRWREAGIEGLATKARSGRPPKTGEEYLQALEEALEKDPHELGCDFSIWTLERLRLHLEKVTGTSLSVVRLHILLKRQGYRYRRPKYDLGHLQDKEAKAQAAALVEELKKSPEQTLSSSSLWTKRR